MAAFSTPVLTVFHQGQVASGAEVTTYVTGTTTPLTTYANAALSTPNANPVTADANGQVTLYIPTTAAMKAVLHTATGEYIDTIDPIYPTANFTSGITSEAVLPSASTTDLGSTGANLIRVTGTTTITSLGASATTGNPIYYVRFAGSLTLTHNGTSLILQRGLNIQTAAGDNAIFQYLGDGNWACLFYEKANGQTLAGVGVANYQVTDASDIALSVAPTHATVGSPVAVTMPAKGNILLLPDLTSSYTGGPDDLVLGLRIGTTNYWPTAQGGSYVPSAYPSGNPNRVTAVGPVGVSGSDLFGGFAVYLPIEGLGIPSGPQTVQLIAAKQGSAGSTTIKGTTTVTRISMSIFDHT